jgi:hypothetical protein
MPGQRGRYAPLLAYLDAVPPEEPWVRMTFAAIEALIVAPLPASAQRPDYWTSSQVARLNWQRIGWAARLDRAAGVVTFTRPPSHG